MGPGWQPFLQDVYYAPRKGIAIDFLPIANMVYPVVLDLEKPVHSTFCDLGIRREIAYYGGAVGASSEDRRDILVIDTSDRYERQIFCDTTHQT